MTQQLASLSFSPAEQAEVSSILAGLYRDCLLQLQTADQIRNAAGVPLPAEAATLYAYLLPRQAALR